MRRDDNATLLDIAHAAAPVEKFVKDTDPGSWRGRKNGSGPSLFPDELA